MYARPLRPPYRLIIVEDHKFVAEMLAQRLAHDTNVQVVGIANTGTSALHLVEHHEVDIALLDMQFDQEDGLAIARDLMAARPGLRIIGLSMHDTDHYPFALLEMGAMGFISKKANGREIRDAIARVAAGDMAISPEIAVHLATQPRGTSPNDLVRRITAKEMDVWLDLAHGYSIKQIARRSGLTEKTIQTHRNNLRKKLGAQTDVELCLIAIKAGLVDIHRRRA